MGLHDDWTLRLRVEATGERINELRRATDTGLPFGDEKFVEEMESRLGCRPRPKPMGPAPKAVRAVVGAA